MCCLLHPFESASRTCSALQASLPFDCKKSLVQSLSGVDFYITFIHFKWKVIVRLPLAGSVYIRLQSILLLSPSICNRCQRGLREKDEYLEVVPL